jgi:hypothetical protein
MLCLTAVFGWNINLHLLMLRRNDEHTATNVRQIAVLSSVTSKKCDIPGLLQSELDNTILQNVGNLKLLEGT